MGRLTLNVLLSFAQFEREVAGERIRDKIAASRRRGIWMGGTIPLGYDVKDRELNEGEARTVREVFDSYVRLGAVDRLRAEVDQRGILSKRWTSSTGRTWGGVEFSRGALYWLLRNPVYVGRVSHKGQVFDGRQPPIVELALWEKVQELLTAKSAGREKRRIVPGGRPLAGLLFDDRGNAMSPSYTVRPSGRRYAYYVSQALVQGAKERAGAVPRVRAEEIERLVSDATDGAQHDATEEPGQAHRISRIVVYRDRVEILKAAEDEEEDSTIIVPARLAYRNRAKILDDGSARPDATIVRALARAHEWRRWLEQDEAHSYRDIANKAEVDASYVQLVLALAFLDPQITRELLDGRRRMVGGLIDLLRRGIPADWQQQRLIFPTQSA